MKSDKQLRDELESVFDSDPRVKAANITVAAKDGIVTLHGYVSSPAEKRIVESESLRRGDVQAVANELHVKLPGCNTLTDEEIAATCINDFDCNFIGALDEKIKVVVSDGWVTAEGHVGWQFQKDAALKVIRNVAGIRGVIDKIAVKPRFLPGGAKTELKYQSRCCQLSNANRF
jgi:osmotically-inducible protein OsmY